MKKQILLFLLAFLPLLAHAFSGEVEIDGINYFIKTSGQIAEVRAKTPKYSGDVVIPLSVVYEGVTCNVVTIGECAFSNCSGLTSVTIPNSVTSIGDGAFYGCSSLTYISIPNSVTSIGVNAFSYCTSVTSLTIPNSVTSIGGGAFFYCTSLTSITIPNSVTSIGNSAFYYCTSLTSITIPNSVTSIDNGTFRECTNLTSITIPNSVTSIGEVAFQGCINLTSITIPNSVTDIGDYAFQNCTYLSSVTIGSGVSFIDEQTFAKCPSLEDVYCYAVNVPSTKTTAFDDSYPECATLHVPDESLAAYSNTDPWSRFGTKVGLSGSGEIQKCATPTISYGGKKLTFSCDTEGVEYISEIKDMDIRKYYDAEISLSATYEISVYATKTGYENSDIATATLVWLTANFTETGTVTAISQEMEQAPIPVLIQSEGGTLTIQGADDGTPVSIYTSAGIQAGSAVCKNGVATISTNLHPGSIAIIKIGNRSVKYMVP